jgi:hypothetical protein
MMMMPPAPVLLLLLLPSAVVSSRCRYAADVDYSTSGSDGFVAKGPTDQDSCCAACVEHVAKPKPCLAAVWVPLQHECVLKLNITAPKHATGTVACVPPSSPLPPAPAPAPGPPVPEATYLMLDSRNVVRKDPSVRLRLAPVVKEQRNPLLTEQHKWELRFDNMGPNVWHDPEAVREQLCVAAARTLVLPSLPVLPVRLLLLSKKLAKNKKLAKKLDRWYYVTCRISGVHGTRRSQHVRTRGCRNHPSAASPPLRTAQRHMRPSLMATAASPCSTLRAATASAGSSRRLGWWSSMATRRIILSAG